MPSRAARRAAFRGRCVARAAIESLERRQLFSVTNVFDAATVTEAGGQPADPNGAVSGSHVVDVVNSEIQWFTRNQTLQHAEALNSFFSPLGTDATSTVTNPKVTYDQYNDRFIVIAQWRLDIAAAGDLTNDSHVLVAVSDDADPNGRWYFQSIDTKVTIGSQDAWLNYAGLAVSQDAVYVTGNMTPFGFPFQTSVNPNEMNLADGSTVLGTRLFILPKTGLYNGGTSFVKTYDPVKQLGLQPMSATNPLFTLQPAHMYGTAPAGVGTYLTLDAGQDAATGHDFLYVIRVDNPLGTASFTSTLIDAGDISTRVFHGAPEPWPVNSPYINLQGGAALPKIATNDERVLSAVWRDGSLYATQEVIPVSGPDAGQVTAHWYQISTGTTTAVATPSLYQQGDIGGEEIGVGVNTYFPAVSVNSRGDVAVGFSASGPMTYGNDATGNPIVTSTPVYVGAYVTSRLKNDPLGTMRPSQVLAAGQDLFVAGNSGFITGPLTSQWGNYSAIQVDPSDETTFWAFNMYALTDTTTPPGPLVPSGPTWGTKWGQFTAELLDLPAVGNFVWNDLNGNGIWDTDSTGTPEPALAGVIFRLYDSNNNLIDQTTSDAAGHWYFQGTPTGQMQFLTQYYIVADISAADTLGNSLLEGFTFSPLNASGNTQEDIDSDFQQTPANLFRAVYPQPVSGVQTYFTLDVTNPLIENIDLGLFKPFIKITTDTPTVAEGGPGAVQQAQFTLSISDGLGAPVISPWNTRVYISTIAVSAASDVDFQSQTLDLITIPAGVSEASFTVPTIGDGTQEGNETFQVKILQPSEVYAYINDLLPPGVAPAELPLVDTSQLLPEDSTASATIVDDDLPVLSIDPGPTIVEGAAGTQQFALFTVRLSSPNQTGTTIRVNYTLANGTATGGTSGTAGADFDNTSGFVEFAAGQLTKTIRVPIFGDFDSTEGNETFTLTITPAAGANVTTGTQTTATATIVDLTTQAITFNANKPARYRDVAGNMVTITLRGPGSGTVIRAASGQGLMLSVTGTTEKSVLIIRTSRGQTTFTGISIAGGLASLDAPTTNVTGSLTSTDAIRSLTLNTLSGGDVDLGASTSSDTAIDIKIKRVVDSNLTSQTAVKTFTVGSWIDTGTADFIVVPSIKTFHATGDFGATLQPLAGGISSVIINGVMKNAAVTSAGAIGSFKAGSIVQSQVTAASRISSLTVGKLFSDTTITANRIDRMEMGKIQNTTAGVLTAAEADYIGSVRWTFNKKTRKITKVDNPGPRGLDKDLDQNPQIILQIT